LTEVIDIHGLDPLEQRMIELIRALDNAACRVDFKYFVEEGLGYHHIANDPDTPGKFEQSRTSRSGSTAATRRHPTAS
jgi:hypothetical protein